MKKLLVVVMMLCREACCQDPQFSQYYAAPLILNPAMAGATDCFRAGINARRQWSGLPGGSFNTASVYFDFNHPDLRSGFGLLGVYDQIGTPKMTTAEISGFYSYLAPVSKMINFRFGLQGTFASKSLDYSNLYFEDQYTGTQLTKASSEDPIKNYTRKNYGDFSAGVLLFGEERYWLGFAAHHLSQPNQGVYTYSKLPMKLSWHGGINLYLKKHPRQNQDDAPRIIPTFMYKMQDKFDQLDLGVYFIESNLLLGLWYRGLPVKRDFNIYNRDAIDAQVGVQLETFSFTYSYDFTISKLNIKNTYGSHEISLVYLFCLDWPKRTKPPRSVRKLPCPDFKRSMKYKKNFLGF